MTAQDDDFFYDGYEYMRHLMDFKTEASGELSLSNYELDENFLWSIGYFGNFLYHLRVLRYARKDQNNYFRTEFLSLYHDK